MTLHAPWCPFKNLAAAMMDHEFSNDVQGIIQKSIISALVEGSNKSRNSSSSSRCTPYCSSRSDSGCGSDMVHKNVVLEFTKRCQ